MAHEVGRLCAWSALYVVAALLGRLTTEPTTQLAVVWPAAGVAALWVLDSSRRRLPGDLLVIGATTWATTWGTGAAVPLATLLGLVNVVQPLFFVGVVALLAPALLRRRRPDTVSAFTAVMVAAVSAGASGALLGNAGLELLGRPHDLGTFALWWGRNAAGLVGLTVLGMLLRGRDAEGRSPRLRRPTRRQVVEGSLLAAYSAGSCWFVFAGPYESLPLGFLLMICAVVVALRFGPEWVALHALATGAACVALTLYGHGPFADATGDPTADALLVQVFVIVAAVTGFVVSFSRCERDRAHRELAALHREAERRATLISGVLEHMQEGVAVCDADGTYLVSNPASQPVTMQLLRAAAQAEPGDDSLGLRTLDGRPLTRDELPYRRAVRGERVRGDYVVQPEGGEPLIVEVTAAPLPVAGGENLAVTSFRDVTEARHDREALSRFAGAVAHDLKRPLSAVRGWSEALLDESRTGTVDPATAVPMLERVVRASGRMDRLIDDLLHYTVVRDAPLQPCDLDLSGMAEDAAEVHRVGPGGALVEVQPGLRVLADPMLVRQVLDNLVGNAVKYVAGGVQPHVRVEGEVDHGWLVLRVRDNGIGVPPALRTRIFDSFERGHADAYHGTGLGLAIVRRAVERCGGRVSVHDAPGGGSVFEVRLPAAPQVEPLPVASPATAVADDVVDPTPPASAAEERHTDLMAC